MKNILIVIILISWCPYKLVPQVTCPIPSMDNPALDLIELDLNEMLIGLEYVEYTCNNQISPKI